MDRKAVTDGWELGFLFLDRPESKSLVVKNSIRIEKISYFTL